MININNLTDLNKSGILEIFTNDNKYELRFCNSILETLTRILTKEVHNNKYRNVDLKELQFFFTEHNIDTRYPTLHKQVLLQHRSLEIEQRNFINLTNRNYNTIRKEVSIDRSGHPVILLINSRYKKFVMKKFKLGEYEEAKEYCKNTSTINFFHT